MPKLSDVLEDTQAKLDEERYLPLRTNFRKHILIGVFISLLIIVVSKYFFPNELSRVGGLLVGCAVIVDIIAHWIQLNPTKFNSKEKALILIVISGTIAVFGTFLWTFGDLI